MLVAAGVVALFVRMLVSLALVLGIIAVAYVVMRFRADRMPAGGARRAAPRRTPSPRTGGKRGARRANRQHVEVLGRVGLTRSSSAVVVQFADRVLLLGTSEQAQPTVLAEIDAATWELCQSASEWTVPVEVATDHDDVASAGALPVPRPTFFEALREATVRRA